MRESSDDLKRRLRWFWTCHRACRRAYQTHLDSSWVAAGHLWMLILCSEVCRLGAECLARNTELDEPTLALCADISAPCGVVCERIEGDERSSQACARACYRCAESCLALLFERADPEIGAPGETAKFRVA